MEQEVLLISPEFIRVNSNLSQNIADKLLLNAIRESTNIDLQNIVGTKMILKLKALVKNNTISATTNNYYKELLDNARFFLLYNVTKRIIVLSSVKIDNAGIKQVSDEHTESLAIDDVFRMSRYYENLADYYAKLLQGYILDNYSHLPEISSNKYYYIKSHLHSIARCGMFLGGARGKRIR